MNVKMIHPSDIEPVLGAKVPHGEEAHVYLTKDALMQTALRMWSMAKDVVDSDDGICEAMHASFFKAAEERKAAEALEMPGVPEAYDTMNRSSYEKATPEERAQVYAALEAAQAKRAALDKTIEALYFHKLVASADGQLTAIGLTRWAENGFPQITMGHKYCAALLCTGTDEETLAFVQPPWSAFFIEVPPGMLPVNSTTQGDTEVRRILVMQLQHKTKGKTWGYIAYTDTLITMWRFGADVSELEPPSIEGEEHFAHLLQSEEFTSQDRRVSTLIGRLIINTCLAMSDKSNIKPIGPGHKTYAASRNKKDERELSVRTFQVGAPVTLDLRDDLKAYVRHGPRKPGGGAPSVQVTVRGHYKLQPYGPRSSLRKVIWRQPFRRGPRDAPVLIRPHELRKEE